MALQKANLPEWVMFKEEHLIDLEDAVTVVTDSTENQVLSINQEGITAVYNEVIKVSNLVAAGSLKDKKEMLQIKMGEVGEDILIVTCGVGCRVMKGDVDKYKLEGYSNILTEESMELLRSKNLIPTGLHLMFSFKILKYTLGDISSIKSTVAEALCELMSAIQGLKNTCYPVLSSLINTAASNVASLPQMLRDKIEILRAIRSQYRTLKMSDTIAYVDKVSTSNKQKARLLQALLEDGYDGLHQQLGLEGIEVEGDVRIHILLSLENDTDKQ
jgi:hypothetical protein